MSRLIRYHKKRGNLKNDILQIAVSDFHSGSNYALFLGRRWNGRKTSHVPMGNQPEIRKQFIKFGEAVRNRRKGKQIVLIHNGDAIDGDHHQSGDVCTVNSLEQADIHIELMNELQKMIRWQRGDRMYYTRGTQVHVNEFETYIAEQMNAELHDLLELETNGVTSWFAHHGPGAGAGANEGNAMRNWIKNVYFDALKDGRKTPDIIYTGHVHNPTYAALSVRSSGFKFRNIHGVILPSWQGKTSYAWRIASMNRNKIGGVIHEIKADGTISVPDFIVMDNK